VFGAGEMAAGALVGSAVISAPASSPRLGPKNAQASQELSPWCWPPAVPPKDTREKRWRMVCDSGCLARRRSCGGGYRKVTGRFGIFRPLNSYIYDIFGFVLSVSPPDSDPSACERGSGRFFPNVRAH